MQVRCKEKPECSGQPITVFITDMNYEPIAPYHFDFSGKAFGSLAKPGLNDKLRHCGIMDVEFRRYILLDDDLRKTSFFSMSMSNMPCTRNKQRKTYTPAVVLQGAVQVAWGEDPVPR